MTGPSAHLLEETANLTQRGVCILGPPKVKAIKLLARTEGTLLDLVYIERALAGLIDLIREPLIFSRSP